MKTSGILTLDDMPAPGRILKEAVREDGGIWFRYVGRVGPRAITRLGEMYWGDCVCVKPETLQELAEEGEEANVAFFLSSGDWIPVMDGRCHGTMGKSGERCIQESAPGQNLCPFHERQRADERSE